MSNFATVWMLKEMYPQSYRPLFSHVSEWDQYVKLDSTLSAIPEGLQPPHSHAASMAKNINHAVELLGEDIVQIHPMSALKEARLPCEYVSVVQNFRNFTEWYLAAGTDSNEGEKSK